MTTAPFDVSADVGRPRVMGILNVTPDSFSDGGLWADTESAIAHGLRLAADGADLVDVGGESTRPGAVRPPLAEELDRVVPVVAGLVAEGVTVSVDTMRAEVARAAVEAGAALVNDVSGGLADPAVLDVVAASGSAYVAMHWRAHSDRMQALATYDGPGGVVAAVCAELTDRLDACDAAGIPRDRVVLDPGLGFAKTAEHNWQLLRAWPLLEGLGRPLLLGASRKSFLGSLLADAAGEPRPPAGREHAHAALVGLLAGRVWGFRVHDVLATCDALAVAARMTQEAPR
ncbi:dihydropteroate synthase [Nocardioides sp.]|uniref:dihydropteroate synthase n=1 Tax=Nocardioides sp. TaxID=35761 RepID=UPI003526E649